MFILIENWWTLLLRGALALLFGGIAIALPLFALTYLVVLFGCYALLDGALCLAAYFKRSAFGHRSSLLLWMGIFGMLLGIATLMYPAMTAALLIGLVAAWAMITGVFEIIAAIQLRREITGEWILAFEGLCSALLGLLIILSPMVGAVLLVWWLGAYATVSGILLLGLAFRLRRFERRVAGIHHRI